MPSTPQTLPPEEQRYPKLILKRKNVSQYWTDLNRRVSTIIWNESIVFAHELQFRLEEEGFPASDVSRAVIYQMRPSPEYPKQRVIQSKVTVIDSPIIYYYKEGRYRSLVDKALDNKTAILAMDRRLKHERKEKPLLDVTKLAISMINDRYERKRFMLAQKRKNKHRFQVSSGNSVEVQLDGEVDIVILDLQDTSRRFAVECKNWAEVIDTNAFQNPKLGLDKHLRRRNIGLVPIFIVRRFWEKVKKAIESANAYFVETDRQFYDEKAWQDCGHQMKKELGYYFIQRVDKACRPSQEMVNQLREILETAS